MARAMKAARFGAPAEVVQVVAFLGLPGREVLSGRDGGRRWWPSIAGSLVQRGIGHDLQNLKFVFLLRARATLA